MSSPPEQRPVTEVAHDLCNLLTVMGAQLERILAALPGDPGLRRAGQAMEEALERANQLTADLVAPPAEAGAAAPAPPARAAACDGGLVLVAEDDRQVRQVLAAMLQSRGFQVEACASADTALAAAAAQRRSLRLAVLDANLPDDPERLLLERLRGDLPGLPVVFVTGATGDELRHLLNGHTALLTKPFRAAELSSMVDRVLAGEAATP